MTNKKLLLLLLLVLIAPVVFAQLDLPPAIKKIQDYNEQYASDVLRSVSFIIAFIAGIATIFSPCILPLLPAYFAITFKEKRRITLSTFMFFLGFALIFVLMGLLAALTGRSLALVFKEINWLIPAVGISLIIFGVMVFFGKGFPGFAIRRKLRVDAIGILLLGIFFAIGWTACIGPIISGILLMASAFRNYATASYLMFAYSLGIFVPLFLLSFFYDKIHIEKLKWMNKEAIIKIRNKKFYTSIPNIIAGLIFVFIGLIFIIFKGTGIFNSFQMFGLRQFFYSWQNLFIENYRVFNIVGIIIFLVFIVLLAHFVVKEIRGKD